ncbi:MAG: Hsp20/alpha crystallin family protein [Acidobacteriia bacterium]|nr:Hsp20/alpha crystallin family protein [Terriglobia bacterium]
MVIRIAGASHSPQTEHEQNQAPTPFRLFEDMFNNWAMQSAFARRRENSKPPVDIWEKDNKIIIRTEIPGVSDEDIDLRLDGRTLTIKGERKPEPEGSGFSYHQVEGCYGTFSRSFDLPDSVDAEKISAAYNNGVLVITVPQKPENKPRTIKVNA